MALVTFRFENGEEVRAQARPTETLLDLAKRFGVAIDAPCNGNGVCGKCRVRLIEGTLDAEKNRHITEEEFSEGWRLACCSRPASDVIIGIPSSASAFKTDIRTADLSDPSVRSAFDSVLQGLEAADVLGEAPVYTKTFVMNAPSLEDTLPDNERLERAVRESTGLNAQLTLTALKKLARVLRESDFTVRCVMESRTSETVKILDVFPADDKAPVCGIAVDIGTTTVSAALADMESHQLLARASAGNGQIRYGADVINRIIESTREGGSERLRKAIVEDTLVPLINRLCEDAHITTDRVYRISIAGNTTMSHLLLGLYSDPVRMEPFIPSFFHIASQHAYNVLPMLNGSARLIMAPNVGSYVGGDITAGILAGELWNSSRLTLFIDLGTNGELVLGNNEYMLCCACSAGPAFEGGDISCGMRATTGAIQAIEIDPETMEPSMDIIGRKGQKPAGLCGSGLIDTVAALFKAGIIDPKGRFIRDGVRVKRDEYGMGRYVLADGDHSFNGREIAINEVDIDNFIRAKGAVFSAALMMLRQIDAAPSDLDSILIAGGIGGGIDFENSIRIGMLPDVPLEKYSYIGNSSLNGAYAMLVSKQAEKKTEALAKNMMYVELSNEPGYMEEFVAACFLPHTNKDLFPSV